MAGDVIVTPDGGEPVPIRQGDLVTFPAAMSWTWNILADIRQLDYFGSISRQGRLDVKKQV